MDAREDLLEYLYFALGTDQKEIVHAIAEHAQPIRVKKGTKLFLLDDKVEDCYSLFDGIVRLYYTDSNGAEHTEWLIDQKGAIIYSRFELAPDMPALVSCDALTDCEMIRCPLSALLELREHHPEYDLIILRILQRALDHIARYKRRLWSLTQQDRYAWMLENRREVVEKVPQKYIASFLGMTPVSLSRIRSRYKQQSREE